MAIFGFGKHNPDIDHDVQQLSGSWEDCMLGNYGYRRSCGAYISGDGTDILVLPKKDRRII